MVFDCITETDMRVYIHKGKKPIILIDANTKKLREGEKAVSDLDQQRFDCSLYSFRFTLMTETVSDSNLRGSHFHSRDMKKIEEEEEKTYLSFVCSNIMDQLQMRSVKRVHNCSWWLISRESSIRLFFIKCKKKKKNFDNGFRLDHLLDLNTFSS